VIADNDCEDQGFSLISEGCFCCLPFAFLDGKPVRQQLERFERNGIWYWRCPKCEGYYGECSEADAAAKAIGSTNEGG
jgi:antirestriction protein